MPMSHSGWAEWRKFSAAMLALVGTFNAAEGLVIVYGGGAIGVERNRMMFLDPRLWGEVSVVLGGLLLVLGGWLWLVTVRVPIAVIVPAVVAHGIVQVGVLAAYPIWALLMIAFDVIIIFALTVSPATAARFAGPDVASSPDDYRPRHLLTPITATVVLGPIPGLATWPQNNPRDNGWPADDDPWAQDGPWPPAATGEPDLFGVAGLDVLTPDGAPEVLDGIVAPARAATAVRTAPANERVRAVVRLPWAGLAPRPAAAGYPAEPAPAGFDDRPPAGFDDRPPAGFDAEPPALVRPWIRNVAGPDGTGHGGPDGAMDVAMDVAMDGPTDGSADDHPAEPGGRPDGSLVPATRVTPALPAAPASPPILGAISGRCPDTPLQV
jgi:hypothetical protein